MFGPQPRSYDFELPKKVERGALRAALAQKLKDGARDRRRRAGGGRDQDQGGGRDAEAARRRPARRVLVDVTPDEKLSRSVRNIAGVALVPSARRDRARRDRTPAASWRRAARSRSCRRRWRSAQAESLNRAEQAMKLRRHPPAAHHREDVDPARGRPDDRVPGGAGREQDRDQARDRAAARREGRERPDQHRARQDEAAGPVRRPPLGLEEGLREAARGREDARVPGRARKSCRFANSTRRRPAPRFQTVQTFDEITTQRAAQAAGRAAAQHRRPQQPAAS